MNGTASHKVPGGRIGAALRLAVLCLSFWGAAWLDPFHDEVRKGNEQYNEKRYHAAKNYYRRAEEYVPSENQKHKLGFNNGDADYRLDEMDGAVASFEQALKSDDKDVQKKAFFNMGNAYMKQGKYKEAVQSFINALKIDPGYEKAKKNIEYLLTKKKDENKEKQGGDKGGGGDGKDKDKNKKDKDKDSKNKQQQKQGGGQGSNLSKAQIKNMLESLKQNPVRRFKGKSNDTRYLEKPW